MKLFGRCAALSLGIAIALTGCVPSAPSAVTSDTAHPPRHKEFSGPWAEVLTSTYDELKSDTERNALADGKISDQEYEYFQDQIVTCLGTHGISAHFSHDGGLDYTSIGSPNQKAVSACTSGNGRVLLVLHDDMTGRLQDND
jgi:hypothetical protein